MHPRLPAIALLLLGATTVLTAPRDAQSTPPATPEPESRVELDNGIRVTFVPLPELQRQTTLTFLPLAQVEDPEGQAQMARLLTRMMWRSTDPKQDVADGIQVGSYSRSGYALLYTVAPLSRWEVALVRHGLWLRPSTWQPGVLERELAELRDESAAALGDPQAAHGLGLEAFSQALRFGDAELDMHGALTHLSSDVDGATTRLAQLIEERVPIGPGIEVYCLGPVSEADQEVVLRREMGALPASKAVEPMEPSLSNKRPSTCTWSLPWRHQWIWYPVEYEKPWHHLGTALLVDRLNFRFAQHRDDGLGSGRAHARLVELGGPMVVLSVALDEDTRPKDALRAVEREIADLGKSRGLAFRDQLDVLGFEPAGDAGASDIGARLAQMHEFMPPEEFERLERERGYMEWNLLVQRLDTQRTYGGDPLQIAGLASGLEVEDLERWVKTVFHRRRRHQMLVSPTD